MYTVVSEIFHVEVTFRVITSTMKLSYKTPNHCVVANKGTFHVIDRMNHCGMQFRIKTV